MAIVVSFLGTFSIPVPESGTAYRVWSYRVDGTGSEIPQGQRMALTLPANVSLLDPSLFPDVDALDGTFLWRDPVSGRHLVGRTATSPGGLIVSFVAPARTSTGELQLLRATSPAGWAPVSFLTGPGGSPAAVQTLVLPAPGAPAHTGRPVYDFAGTLPYASELFGVYQPLIGWIGAQTTMTSAMVLPDSRHPALSHERFLGEAARTLSDDALAAVADRQRVMAAGGLSPVGLVSLFRQYFF
ncbi:hypothetical protein, partial [Phytohabitans houttuyneae]